MTTTDKNGKEISKGSIVRYKDGWMEVTAAFKDHVNLGSIFVSKTKIKKVPTSDIYEDNEAWFKSWSQSETYMCM